MIYDPGARAAIETMIALGAVMSSVLVFGQFKRSRQVGDLLLLGALATLGLTDFVFSALPALAGVGTSLVHGGQHGGDALVAIPVVGAAFAPRNGRVRVRRRLVVIMPLLVLGAAGVTALLPLIAVRGNAVAFALHVSAAAVLLTAAVGFAVRANGDRPALLLSGASLLLGAARIQYLVVPAVSPHAVSPREWFRLAACGLLLAAACLQWVKARRENTEAALHAERRRIARDLHDGLAQDLAFIVGQGERLESQFGPDHLVTVAARRALAVSRGAIMDLSASRARSTEGALREVAAELSARFGLQVDVRITEDPGGSGSGQFESHERDDLVRIAREAVVNAVRHGGARRVEIVLDRSGSSRVLRVSDDGAGIAAGSSTGFGMRSMGERARSLGGRVDAYPARDGGTELEVVLS